MAEASFHQRAAEQAAFDRRTKLAHDESRQPFAASIGSVHVALKVCVGKPCYVTPDGARRQAEVDQLLVVLAMSNAGDGATVRYQGWGDGPATGPASLAASAALSDDLGNRYVVLGTSRGLERWVGQVSGARSVGPGETLTDVLVFAAPTPKAQRLTLELPRGNLCGVGTLRVNVPVGRVANFVGAAE